jgi:hypothetical protein
VQPGPLRRHRFELAGWAGTRYDLHQDPREPLDVIAARATVDQIRSRAGSDGDLMIPEAIVRLTIERWR